MVTEPWDEQKIKAELIELYLKAKEDKDMRLAFEILVIIREWRILDKPLHTSPPKYNIHPGR